LTTRSDLLLHIPEKARNLINLASAELIQKSQDQGTVSTFFQDRNHVLDVHRSDLTFTAFILYRQHHNTEIVKQNPGVNNPDISKIIGHLWKNESEEEKNRWKAFAEV